MSTTRRIRSRRPFTNLRSLRRAIFDAPNSCSNGSFDDAESQTYDLMGTCSTNGGSDLLQATIAAAVLFDEPDGWRPWIACCETSSWATGGRRLCVVPTLPRRVQGAEGLGTQELLVPDKGGAGCRTLVRTIARIVRSEPRGQWCGRGAAAWTPCASPAVCVPMQSGPIKQQQDSIGLLLGDYTGNDITLRARDTFRRHRKHGMVRQPAACRQRRPRARRWETSGTDAVAVPNRLSTAGSNCPSPSSK